MVEHDLNMPLFAFITYGDGTTEDVMLPAGPGFFGVTEATASVVSIHIGLADGTPDDCDDTPTEPGTDPGTDTGTDPGEGPGAKSSGCDNGSGFGGSLFVLPAALLGLPRRRS